MKNHRPPRPEQQHHRSYTWRLLLSLLALMAVFAAACGGGGGDSSLVDSASDVAIDTSAATDSFDGDFDSPAAEFSDDEAMSDAEAPEVDADRANAGVTTTGAAGTEVTAQLPDLGRDIIFTAWIELGSTDVSVATRDAIRAIEARGGFLFSQETRGGAGGTSVMTFKVLPDQFQAALNDLGSVGTVRSQSISADDVSAVVVDLESRINTAEASVIRLRNLLEDATELETIATLENQLLQRETSLEQLRGQLRTVRNQVDLATITVTITELTNRPGLSIETMALAGHDGGFSCFDDRNIRSAEAGDPITICYRVTNTGDTPLVDLAIDDPALGATIGTVVVVDGSPTTTIEPGEIVLLAHETELSEDVRLRTSVTATGLDADGNEIEDQVQATAPTVRFEVIEVDDGTPGFGEVLGNSWNALKTAAIVIALVAVAIAPFAVAALLIGGPIWLLLRRRRATRPAKQQKPQPTPPAPPAPTAPAPTAPAPPTPPTAAVADAGDVAGEAAETTAEATPPA